MAYEEYHDEDGCIIPRAMSAFHNDISACVTGKSLMRKGLVSHSVEQQPTWQITDEGRAMASLIVKQARTIVEIANSADRSSPAIQDA